MDTTQIVDLQTKLAAAQAEAETHKYRYDTLKRIILADWKRATHRIAYAATQIHMWESGATGEYVTLDDLTEQRLAQITHLSKPTVGDALRTFEQVGLLDRDQQRTAVNRYGDPISRKDVRLENGDGYRSISITKLPAHVPAELPELPETPRAQRDKQRADETRKLAQIGRELLAQPCPECGAVGEWHLTCGDCGAKWTAQELAQGENANTQDSCVPLQAAVAAQDNDPLTIAVEMGNQADAQTPTEADLDPNRLQEGDQIDQADALHTNSLPTLITDKNLASCDGSTKVCGGNLRASDAQTDTPTPTPADHSTQESLPPVETITGAETVDALATLLGDNVFCLVYKPGEDLGHGKVSNGKEAFNPRDEWGDELSWPEHPVSASAAKLHQARGGNVGLLGGDRRVWLDVDKGLADFLKLYPMMQMQGRVYRDSAPDRAKILILLHEGESLPSKVYEGNGRKVEVLSTGKQGVCAGTHQSGDTIKFLPPYDPDDPDVFHASKIDAMLEQFTGAQQAQAQTITPPARKATAGTVRSSGDMLREAIKWWNEQPQNQQAVKNLLATCKHSGGYVAIRPDDKHPSTRADRDTYAQTVKETWHDYGAAETLDCFELFCRLSDKDKRSYKWTVVQEYRAAQGLPPLKLS